MNQLFMSGGQSIGASASASVLPMSIQGISFRIDWLDHLAAQGTLKSLLQQHNSKASVLQSSAFFTVQLSLLVLVLVAQSCPALCNPMEPVRLLCPWDSPGTNIGVGCHCLLQGIFPTQGSNPVSCIAGRFFTI